MFGSPYQYAAGDVAYIQRGGGGTQSTQDVTKLTKQQLMGGLAGLQSEMHTKGMSMTGNHIITS